MLSVWMFCDEFDVGGLVPLGTMEGVREVTAGVELEFEGREFVVGEKNAVADFKYPPAFSLT